MGIKDKMESLGLSIKSFYETEIKLARHEEQLKLKTEVLSIKEQLNQLEEHSQALEKISQQLIKEQLNQLEEHSQALEKISQQLIRAEENLNALGNALMQLENLQQSLSGLNNETNANRETLENIINGLDSLQGFCNNLEGILPQLNNDTKYIISTFEEHNVRVDTLQNDIQVDIKRANDQLHKVYCIEKENQWANRFHDSISSSDWLNIDGMAPGGFAAGYQLLYLLFKILDIKKPSHILDIGLGQTTQMITMYVENNNPLAEHLTIEGDSSFIEFWSKNHYLSDRTRILKLDYGIQEYSNSEVRIFEGFREQIKDKEFDLIIIDAPFGGDMKEFSRIDILECIPECLAKDFVIILDDTHRRGEINTGKAIEEKLSKNDIHFASGRYIGETTCTIWTSLDNSFLCTL